MKTLRDTEGKRHEMTNEDAAFWLRHGRFALVDQADPADIDADTQKVLDETNPKTTEDFTPSNDAGVTAKTAKTKKTTTKK